ncbi:hypothetical protein [Streptomyces sp. NPDC127084]|uniref:hypothetical protein n=1 Tax=Streptomyces sp. NPDC127084 TaxID=3347133 RepID=UPI0036486A5F
MTTRHKRAAAALSGAVALVLALAGCGGDGDDKAPSPPSAQASTPAPSTSAADPQAAEKAAVLAVYSSMSAEQMKAYRKADAKGTDLEKYATAKALGQIRNDLARMKEAGTVVRGEIGHDAKVTGIDLEAEMPKATLSDCVDLSKYERYSIKRQEPIPLPTEQPLRYIMTVQAEQWNGRWMVTAINPQGGPTC